MRPLANIRILITRTRHQASDLAAQLEALGATPILIPTIEIIPPETYAPLDSALTQLDLFDWLIFTSANAVDVFHQRRNPALTPKRIAAIGPATAKAVEGIGVPVDLIPPQFIAESLAEALIPHAPNSRMLLIRAAEARDILPAALAAAGAHLTIVDAYRNQIPPGSIPALHTLFNSPEHYPDVITFTSASTARNLAALLEAADLTVPPNIIFASIGPITTQALRELGLQPILEAPEPTISALVQVIAAHFFDA